MGLPNPSRLPDLIETGAQGADRTRALVSIQTARQLFSKNKSYATEILVNVNDYNDAQEIAARNQQSDRLQSGGLAGGK